MNRKKRWPARAVQAAAGLLLATAVLNLLYNLFLACTISRCATSGLPVMLPLMGAALLLIVLRVVPALHIHRP